MTLHGKPRLFAFLVGALIPLPGLAQTCEVSTSGGSGGSDFGDAVFSVMDGGTITVGGGYDANGACNLKFYGSDALNVTYDSYLSPGTGTYGQPCSNEDGTPMTPTNDNPPPIDLPAFPSETGTADITRSNPGQMTISNAGEHVYRNLTTMNGGHFLFKNESGEPFIIDQLTLSGCNGADTLFEPGDYYIRRFFQQATCDIQVSGNGRVNLYFLGQDANGNTTGVQINGGPTNVNYDTSKSAENQSPEHLGIYVYHGNLTAQNNDRIAAGIYVAEGVLDLSSGPTTFVGEALAGSVTVQNNTSSGFYYKDAGLYEDTDTSTVTTTQWTGEYSLASPAVPFNSSTGDYVYIASQTDVPGISGHLRAFRLLANGNTETDSVWDAAEKMTTTDRANRLYSNDVSGDLALFTALDSGAFEASTPTPETIKAYTINPDENDGAYLAGREADSLMGAPYTSQPVIMGKLVLQQTDDGFLYAFDRDSGELQWGWIGRAQLASLQDYASFQSSHPMQGQISVLTDDASGATSAGYIAGTARGGRIHYLLHVGSDGMLDATDWVDDAGTGTTSPNAHAPILYTVGSTTYALYIVNDTIVRRSIASQANEVSYSVSGLGGATLSAEPIAALETVPDDHGGYQTNIKLFIGASNGNLYSALMASNGSVAAAGTLSLTLVGNIGAASSAAEPVLYLESTTLSGKGVLIAESATRVKVFQSDADGNAWQPLWTSYVGGAGTWNAQGGYVASTASGPSTEAVQPLPEDAQITAAPQLADGTVLIPVTVTSDDDCFGQAYDYLYTLADGNFPEQTRYNGALLLQNVQVGAGTATTPQLTRLNGEWVVEGSSSQNNAVNGSVLGGLDDSYSFTRATHWGRAGWRELTGE